MVYSEEEKMLGALNSKRMIIFWDLDDLSEKKKKKKFQPLHKHEMVRLMKGIWYFPTKMLWMTSSNSFTFTIYRTNRNSKGFITELKTFPGHELMITDACDIFNTPYISTSS